jgi:hypothetical protein
MGSFARAEFERQLAATRDRGLVRRAYERLGWSPTDCNIKMVFNDAQSDNDRQVRVISFLESWPKG